jgi:hypothetical protein
LRPHLPHLQALALAGKTQREAMQELGLPEDCSLQAFYQYVRCGWEVLKSFTDQPCEAD